jgi:hypothetical protein
MAAFGLHYPVFLNGRGTHAHVLKMFDAAIDYR